MIEKNNIENIFRNAFENYEAKPTNKVWGSINTRLWWVNIENALKNIAVSPSPNVWRYIYIKLLFYNFLRFNAMSFNIYYLLVAILGASLFFAMPNNKYNTPELSEQNNANTFISNNNENNLISEKASLEESLALVSEAIFTDKILKEEKANTNKIIIYNSDDEKMESINNSDIEEIKNDKNISRLEGILFKGLSNNESKINNLNIDTLAYDYKGLPIVEQKSFMSLDIYAAALFNEISLVNNNLLFAEQAQYGNNTLAKPGFSIGLGMNFHKKNNLFQVGVNYTEYRQESKYKTIKHFPDTIFELDIIQGGYYDYQTIWVINLDSLILGDTVYVAIVDSQFVHTTDTILKQHILNKRKIVDDNTSLRISYIELPITYGYRLTKGRTNLNIKLSIIPGLYTFSRGYIISPYSEYGLLPSQKLSFNKFVLSGAVGLEFYHNVNDRLGIVAEPYFRHNFTQIFDKDFVINQKYKSYGLIKLGIRYKL